MPSSSPTAPRPTVAELVPALMRGLTWTGTGHRPSGRPAAVLVPLFDHRDEAHLLLTKRADHLSAHPGQISLPGGACDPGDVSLAATALRETHEELGLSPEHFTVLGELAPVHTMVSGFLVHPVVAVADRPLKPVPADAEVARVMVVAVADVLEADRALPADAGVATLRYPLDGEDVWGATARILRVFCAAIRAGGHHG